MRPQADSNNSKGGFKKRILLKLSGESLLGKQNFGVCPGALNQIANNIAEASKVGIQIALVLGAGNIFRGITLNSAGIDRITGDNMGMLATVMNGLALRDALEDINIPTEILSSFAIKGIAPAYERKLAIKYLNNNKVVVLVGGTGNPLFTTDTAACLRGIEIKADMILKATKVDGVYSEDPKINPNAIKYDTMTFDDALEKKLQVMDLTAMCLMRAHNTPVCVFNMHKKNALKSIASGKNEGTIIYPN